MVEIREPAEPKSLNDIKIEYSGHHKALEDFLKEKLKLRPVDLIKAGGGAGNPIRNILNSEGHFEKVIGFLKNGFGIKAEERDLNEADKNKFEQLVGNIVSGFYELQNAKSGIKSAKAPDAENIRTAKEKFFAATENFTKFAEDTLEIKVKELYSLGRGIEDSSKAYMPYTIYASSDSKIHFSDAMDNIESGFKKLHATVNYRDETVVQANSLIKDIRDKYNGFLRSRGKVTESNYKV